MSLSLLAFFAIAVLALTWGYLIELSMLYEALAVKHDRLEKEFQRVHGNVMCSIYKCHERINALEKHEPVIVFPHRGFTSYDRDESLN